MENPKTNKVVDLRQSPGWEGFLEFLGWKVFRTKNAEIAVAVRKSPFGSVSKVQRPKNVNSTDLAEIEEICKKERVMFTKLEPSLEQDLKVLEDFGYIRSNYPLTPPSTIFIDLRQNEEKLWENLSRSAKYSINRARREAVKIETYQKPSEKVLEEFCRVAKEAAKFKGFIAPSLSDLKTKVKLFGDKSYVIFAKDASGNVTGANFYLGFDDCVWFLHGGTSSTGRKGKWGYELFWQRFLYFKGLGYKLLDL